jgi:hypothetical protein
MPWRSWTIFYPGRGDNSGFHWRTPPSRSKNGKWPRRYYRKGHKERRAIRDIVLKGVQSTNTMVSSVAWHLLAEDTAGE